MQLCLSTQLKIKSEVFPAATAFFVRLAKYTFGIEPAVTLGETADILFIKEEREKESFRIEIEEGTAKIYAGDVRGAIYGAGELLSRFYRKDGKVLADAASISEAPYKEMRGVHLMPPGLDEIEEFKNLLDALAFLKYNMVTIEVGAAMELERRPEVNRIWQMFCDIVQNKFPGGPHNMQWAYKYWKDSPHTLNANGEIIPKKTMRELVTYAKDLGFLVVPEIQSLSHAYYLTLPYRDIAEDAEDVFPDTFCPQNEKSYEIYFDIAEEIIEVFEPSLVSIGHDEIRVLCECEACKDKPGHELLSREITRLHDFYEKKGIRIAMWAEKLIHPDKFGGRKLGGAAVERTDAYGRHWYLPETFDAIEDVPRDIYMIDWYYMLSSRSEEDFKSHEMDIYYGNFRGLLFADWEKRSQNVHGAMVSTWCPPTEEFLGRDGILTNLAFTAQMLWRSDCTNDAYESFLTASMKLAEPIKCILRQKAAKPFENAEPIFLGEAGEEEICGANLEGASDEAVKLLAKHEKLSGRKIDVNPLRVKTDIFANELIFVSAYTKAEAFYPSYAFLNTKTFMDSPYEGSWRNVHLPRWDAAVMAVIYEDNTIEIINMTYGKAAADVHMDWKRKRLSSVANLTEIDVMDENDTRKLEEDPSFEIADEWLYSAAYYTYPVRDGNKTAYVYTWENPHPEKKIKQISSISTTHDTAQSLLLYEIAYI